MKKMKIILDCEVYKNYFLVCCQDVDTGKIASIEMHNDVLKTSDRPMLQKMMNQNVTIGFNSNNYDLLILCGFLRGFTNQDLKNLSDLIIGSKKPGWQIPKECSLTIPRGWNHIDLIEVAPGKASLKIYGGRLGTVKMQDLPIEPDSKITKADAIELVEYCKNDLQITKELYLNLLPQLELREKMSEKYCVDLRSKSDAQIAETVIKQEYEKITGKTIYKKDSTKEDFIYTDPGIVNFKSENLKKIFDKVLNTTFTLGLNGAVQLPKWLKDERIVISNTNYQMGIGGLHSCEKKQYIDVYKTDKQLIDLDVASYYPNIILQQKLAPEALKDGFIGVYKSLVSERLKAKRNGDKVKAETLKICINGSFGKLGSKWSALYSPELLIQTTLTGQLCLLMLIERLEENDINVISANTDGIVTLSDKKQTDKLNEIAFDWMLDTSFELEQTNYIKLASRDVNNYIAVKPDKTTKGKGIFASTGLMKNPDMQIITESVANFLATGRSIDDYITNCKDIRKFVNVRRVNGGAVYIDNYLGKAVRFYYSNETQDNECLRYKTNSNKVPKSDKAKPLMDLPDHPPNDIDYERYILEAKKILKEVGYE